MSILSSFARDQLAVGTTDFFESAIRRPDYAGYTTVNQGERYLLYFTDIGEEVQAFVNDRFPAPEFVELHDAPYSREAILDFESRFETTIASWDRRSLVHSVGVLPPEPALAVFLDPSATAEGIAFLRRQTPLALNIDMQGAFVPSACTSANSCNSPRQAGVRINHEGGYCSSGPVVHIFILVSQ